VVFEDVFELDDVVMLQGLVDLDLGYKLSGHTPTFCFARERFRELFAIILAADTLLV